MSADTPKPSYDVAALVYNGQVLSQVRSSMAIVFGSAAGVLGLTNFTGVLFYLAASVLMSVTLIAFSAGCSPERYLNSKSAIWTEGVVGGLFSYVLFWTLLYGMVHVYD